MFQKEPRHVDRARYLPPSELSNGGKYLKKEKMGGTPVSGSMVVIKHGR
jgi:hypothetical protein